jgi:hypothetical protein
MHNANLFISINLTLPPGLKLSFTGLPRLSMHQIQISTLKTELNCQMCQQHFRELILQRVESLLSHDRKISKYTRAVATEWLDKHVSAATDTHATIEELLERRVCW